MKRTALIIVLLAACGGGKKSSTPTTETPMETAPPTETATPTETTPPAETKPAEPDPAVVAKEELTAQLEAGKKVYADKGCAKCHGDAGAGNKTNPALIGEKALPEKPAKTAKLRKGVTFKTVKDVHDFIKAKMPLKAPGTLTDDEAAAVTAWIATENKLTLEKKLDAEGAAAINLR